jgi:hypothetical protein
MAKNKKLTEAVSTILECIAETKEDVAKITKAKTKRTYLAIYQQNIYDAQYDEMGARITTKEALAAYYKKFPTRDPANWSVLRSNGSYPRFVVEVKDGDFEAARAKIDSAMDGLKLLSGTSLDVFDDGYGGSGKTRYHVVEITEEV